ncbi:ATP-binding protein [uncultured Oscillibacter sp.]|uniref:sensor histidine kinase n=1 Tax=uncultured Oscillibacter sp. TaxID=876091 RepID=UPI0028052C7C|nr:ATP-binding protein [uncultured Oscillibacter sp.]
MLKRRLGQIEIDQQLYLFQIFGIIVTAALCLVLTISVTLTRNNRQQEQQLLEECKTMARAKNVVAALEAGSGGEALSNYLNIYIKSISDLDFVAVCDTANTCLYYPNRAFVGRTLRFGGEDRVLAGEAPYIVTVERTGYGLEMAYAPVTDRAGTLLGYVILSVFHQSSSDDVQHLLYLYMVISFGTAFLGIFVSISIRRRTLRVLQGRRVEEYRRLADERNEVLDALDEAIVAINRKGEVIMMNKAFLKMLGRPEQLHHYEGALKDIFPETALVHVLETGTAQYNVSVRIHGEDYVSSRIPVYEEGRLIGAASISRNVTEIRRLGQELSETNQMVDTLRSFNHEFNNKLHVILGYLEQQDPAEAKNFIIHNVGAVSSNVDKVSQEIESTGIAAIIIGKMVEASGCGISLELQADSYCKHLTEGVPFDCYVTVLGNLLQNAIDELRERGGGVKEISLGLFIDEIYTILTVTDTGRGLPESVRAHLFEKGTSTKGPGHGTGLFLVRALVEQYGGTIEVETEPGEGTSVTVSFQRRTAQGGAACIE